MSYQRTRRPLKRLACSSKSTGQSRTFTARDDAAVSANAIKVACTGTDREKFRAALAQTTNFPLAMVGSVTWKNPPTGNNLTPAAEVVVVTGSGTGDVINP